MRKKIIIRSIIICTILFLSCSDDDNSNEFDTTIGLVAHYPLNGDLNDYSGNENHAVNENNVVFDVDASGNENQAARFSNNSYFEVVSSDDINFGSNNFSISLWLYSESNETQMVFQKGGVNQSVDPQYWLRLNDSNGNITFLTGDGNDQSVFTSDSTSNVTDSKWHHLVVLRDEKTLKIYLDKGLVSETEGDIENVSSGQTLKFGIQLVNSSTFDNNSFIGLMDDIRIYNKALSVEGIEALNNLN